MQPSELRLEELQDQLNQINQLNTDGEFKDALMMVNSLAHKLFLVDDYNEITESTPLILQAMTLFKLTVVSILSNDRLNHRDSKLTLSFIYQLINVLFRTDSNTLTDLNQTHQLGSKMAYQPMNNSLSVFLAVNMLLILPYQNFLKSQFNTLFLNNDVKQFDRVVQFTLLELQSLNLSYQIEDANILNLSTDATYNFFEQRQRMEKFTSVYDDVNQALKVFNYQGTKLVKYHKIVASDLSFELWCKENNIDVNKKRHLVEQRYLELYKKLYFES